MIGFKPKPYWLIHHKVLLEWTTEPIKERRDYVKEDKPIDQIPIRLKWMKPVKRPDLLPKAVVEQKGSYTSLKRHWKKIVARHKAEYPECPFDYKLKTLFPRSCKP